MVDNDICDSNDISIGITSFQFLSEHLNSRVHILTKKMQNLEQLNIYELCRILKLFWMWHQQAINNNQLSRE